MIVPCGKGGGLAQFAHYFLAVQIWKNALDVMMAAVVGMGGDSGTSQEHRVELALAALAATSGEHLHVACHVSGATAVQAGV
jgi:hypothetical protein